MHLLYSKCLLLISLLFVIPPKKGLQRKLINSKEGDYIIYVSIDTDIKPKKNMTYFWYKSGSVHQATGGIGGSLLHKDYLKYFKNQQLAESGKFYYGRKDGLWKSWHPNGRLSEVFHYQKGKLQGKYIAYDSVGKILRTGKYRNGLKSSTWIDYRGVSDTVHYKNGIIKEKPVQRDNPDSLTSKKNNFLKRWSSSAKQKRALKKTNLTQQKKRTERKENRQKKKDKKNNS